MSATPATLGAKVDSYYKVRAKRLAAEKKIEEQKKSEAAMKEEILRMLTSLKLDGAKGKVATVAITTTEFPVISDPTAFYQHVISTGSVDLLEKRPSKSGCQERWEKGEEVPGVEKKSRVDLSFTKAAR